MKTGLFVAGLVVASLTAAGCRNPFESDETVMLGVETIEAPATVAPNATLSVVFKVVTGGCVRFDRLQVSRTSTGATVIAWGKDSGGKNVACPADIRIEPHAYEFAPPFTGSFVIVVPQQNAPSKTATVQAQ
ncbi:MAG TPA: hypothetical protein VM166_14595 [Gemmatimonadaceae bacterium]|nr:hypothetical protein [Gemmatimonadaceae bacterium]